MDVEPKVWLLWDCSDYYTDVHPTEEAASTAYHRARRSTPPDTYIEEREVLP